MITFKNTAWMTVATMAALLMASRGSMQAGEYIPGSSVYLIASLDGPNHVGRAEYISTPLYRAFVAEVRYKAIGPDSTPVTPVVCLQRGGYMVKLGRAVLDRPGTYSLLIDTRQSQSVPLMRHGDKIVFIGGRGEVYMAKGALKYPRIGP